MILRMTRSHLPLLAFIRCARGARLRLSLARAPRVKHTRNVWMGIAKQGTKRDLLARRGRTFFIHVKIIAG